MNLHSVVNYFSNPKRLSSSSYQVSCPCHNDKENSLTISEKGDKILMHCHAGCDTRDIVSAVGLTMADLNNGVQVETSNWKSKLEKHLGKLEAVYNYGDYLKLRFEGKKMLYGTLQNGEFVKGIDGIPRTLYNLDAVKKAIKNGYPVYIVEGEKDVDTLKNFGYTATTAGGASDWRKEYASYFRGARVVILPDNDDAGRNLCKIIKKDLRNVASAIKVVTTSNEPKGDVTDYFNEGNSVDDFKGLLKSLPYEWADWLIVNKEVPVKVNADKLARAITENLSYVMLKRQGYDIADFYVYDNGVYKKCSKQEFKSYIKSYIPIGLASDTILNNIYNLVGCSGENVYEFDYADSNESVINLQNGLLDLKKGELVQHSADCISTIQLNCKYDKNAQAPVFMKFVKKLCSDKSGVVDNEKLMLLQEWTGLLLSNITINRVKKCLVLYSALGNTGKSVFLNLICRILGGEHTINIPIQNMSDRFALSDLYGKRLDVVGDQQADAIENSSGFKQLTGGDRVKVEFKGKQSFDWVFRGGILVSCNDLPYFADDKGGHIFERMTILPCDSPVAVEERDGGLIDKITKEVDGVFLWALEGLIRLNKNRYKFTDCQASKAILNEYRANLDTVYRFLDECFEITDEKTDRIKKTDFEAQYQKWCVVNDFKALNKRNIKERAEKNGIGCVKYYGIYCYTGLKEKEKEIEFFEMPESEAKDEQLPIEFTENS